MAESDRVENIKLWRPNEEVVYHNKVCNNRISTKYGLLQKIPCSNPRYEKALTIRISASVFIGVYMGPKNLI